MRSADGGFILLRLNHLLPRTIGRWFHFVVQDTRGLLQGFIRSGLFSPIFFSEIGSISIPF